MRRRLLAVGLSFLLAASVATSPGSSFADTEDVSVWFNGEPVQFEVAPVIREDRTFVPVRFVLERIQADIKWDEVKRQVLITYGPKNVTLSIDSRTVLVNGKPTEIDVAPFIYKDRTMVPLRFLAETFGFTVDWQASIRTVVLIPPSPLIGMIDVPSSPGSGESTGTAPASEVETPALTKGGTTPPTPGATTTPITGGTAAPTSGSVTTPNRGSVTATLRIEGPQRVRVGEEFTVKVWLDNAVSVKGADVTLQFDREKLEGLTIRSGRIVDGVSLPPMIDQERGVAVYSAALPGTATYTGSGLLYSVTFKATATGDAVFSLQSLIGRDPMLKDISTATIPLVATGTTITIDS